MKDESRRMKDEGIQPKSGAVAVVWPPAPEAERLSVLMRSKAELKRLMHPSRNATEHTGRSRA